MGLEQLDRLLALIGILIHDIRHTQQHILPVSLLIDFAENTQRTLELSGVEERIGCELEIHRFFRLLQQELCLLFCQLGFADSQIERDKKPVDLYGVGMLAVPRFESINTLCDMGVAHQGIGRLFEEIGLFPRLIIELAKYLPGRLIGFILLIEQSPDDHLVIRDPHQLFGGGQCCKQKHSKCYTIPGHSFLTSSSSCLNCSQNGKVRHWLGRTG